MEIKDQLQLISVVCFIIVTLVFYYFNYLETFSYVVLILVIWILLLIGLIIFFKGCKKEKKTKDSLFV